MSINIEEFNNTTSESLDNSNISPNKQHRDLFTPTKANINSQLYLQENFGKVKPEDDIWWNKRSDDLLSHPSKHYEHVSSKLLQPTTASLLQQTHKFELNSNSSESVSSPEKSSPVAVEVSQSLLRTTANLENSKWHKRHSEPNIAKFLPIELTEARKASLASGPDNVEPRLHMPTKAYESSKWKSKEEIEAEELAKLLAEKEKIVIGKDVKITKLSDHILAPTQANETGRYVKPAVEPDPREVGWQKYTANANVTSKPIDSLVDKDIPATPPLKVKEVSSHLLTPTENNENAKWSKYIQQTQISTQISTNTPVKELSTHLLSLTAANEASKYVKPQIEIDPREKNWKSPLTSKSFDQLQPKDTDSISSGGSETKSRKSLTLQPTKRVSQTSAHLLQLTENNEYGRWKPKESEGSGKKVVNYKPVPDHLLKSTESIEHGRWVKATSPVRRHSLTPTKDISISPHLLKLTEANERSKYIPPSKTPEKTINVNKINRPVSEHLLKLTSNLQHSKYIKPEDRQVVEEEEEEIITDPNILRFKSPARKVIEVSDHLLKPTVNNEHSRWSIASATNQPLVSSINTSEKSSHISEHLLKPTENNEHSKWTGPVRRNSRSADNLQNLITKPKINTGKTAKDMLVGVDDIENDS